MRKNEFCLHDVPGSKILEQKAREPAFSHTGRIGVLKQKGILTVPLSKHLQGC